MIGVWYGIDFNDGTQTTLVTRGNLRLGYVSEPGIPFWSMDHDVDIYFLI